MPIIRVSSDEGKPHSSKKGRRAASQRAYIRQFGPQPPRRKRLTPEDTTRSDRLKKIEDVHERFGGGEKGKPHSSREGRVASGRGRLERYKKRAQDMMKPKWPIRKHIKRNPAQPLARGGKAGTGPSPGTRIKARKSREREWWTSRGGPEGTKGDTRGEKFFGPLDKELRKKRPHSSPEGRDIDVRAAHAKYAKEHKRRQYPKMPKHGYGGTPTLKRAAKSIGGATKIVPRITKRFLDFIKTGKHVDKHGVKVNVPKAAERLTGKPHVDHGKRKKIKHLGKGKAAGGRISRGQGGSAAQQHYLQHGYGPVKTKLRSGKPKIAIKGWS